MDVRIGKSITKDDALWRYMSIDKFIDLLSKKSLFLTPLSYYQKTDPFEGLLPKATYQLMIQTLKSQNIKSEQKIRQLEEIYIDQVRADLITPTKEQNIAIASFKNFSKEARDELTLLINKICKSTCVHCWYQSESESEAMWKLYSDSGKGIAIKTSVNSLSKSINECNPKVHISLGKVKYLNFLSDELTPSDYVIDGEISPLLKRKEYEHENEVRLYTSPEINGLNEWRLYEPSPINIDIQPHILIEKIYISPYVGEPFHSSVNKICEIFKIPSEKIIKSQLLDDYETMLNSFIKF